MVNFSYLTQCLGIVGLYRNISYFVKTKCMGGGNLIFFASDELYLKAGLPLPEEEVYEGFPQLENGVGMLRLLRQEFCRGLDLMEPEEMEGTTPFSIATGVSAAPFLTELIGLAREKCGKIEGAVYPIRNEFFGETITVAGLVTGGDLIAQLRGKPLGKRLLIPLLILTFTGACLRPPLLILLSKVRTSPVPFTTMDSDNPWHERLRSIRYDRQEQTWLLYTSEGFFTAPTLTTPARKIPLVPPVSIMGINVLEPLKDGQWLVGSFSGLFQWDRERGDVTDLYTGKAPLPRKIPISEQMISGAALDDEWIRFDYNKGATSLQGTTRFPDMPDRLADRPMALWNLALEMHTGRYFTCLGDWSLIYPFLLGTCLFAVLFSGWKIRKK